MALAFCASAFAEPGKNVVQLKERQAKATVRKVCYTMISNSAIPQPCERLATSIPTTASPMEIIR